MPPSRAFARALVSVQGRDLVHEPVAERRA